MDEASNSAAIMAAAGEIGHSNSGDLFEDAKMIVEQSRSFTCKAVNVALVRRNWLLGKRIAEEELSGADHADYGKKVISDLARRLTASFGKGFTRSNLYRYVQFYRAYPEIVATLSRQSADLLSWSHYLVLLRVTNGDARTWYEKEAVSQGWSVRTLDRNVSTLYYERLLASQNTKPVEEEMELKTRELQSDHLEFIKNPVIAEFLGVPQDKEYLESDLEEAIISNLQKFLMELGKGYAFVARQQRVKTDIDDFYIDLVFYNYILKCFVLIDLKTSKITHQDVGQMDMYVRMYDDLKRGEGDNPTLGIVLCSETSDTIARYSVLHDNKHLFASKYKLYLPSEDELRAEIENQKTMFALQHGGGNDDCGFEESDIL